MAKMDSGIIRVNGYLVAFSVGLFVLAMIAVQAAYPCTNGVCYNPLTNPISDLGNTSTSPLWPVFNYTIVMFGLLTIFGILRLMGLFATRAGVVGMALLVAAMLGAMGVGIVPENTILPIHSLFALIAFGLSGPAAILIGYSRLNTKPSWYPRFSILMGALTLLAFLVFVAPQFGLIPAWKIAGGSFGFGGAERLIVAPVLLWLLITGLFADRMAVTKSQ